MFGVLPPRWSIKSSPQLSCGDDFIDHRGGRTPNIYSRQHINQNFTLKKKSRSGNLVSERFRNFGRDL
jgi:hypothetical protein